MNCRFFWITRCKSSNVAAPGVEPLNSFYSPILPAASLRILKIIGRKSEIRLKQFKSVKIDSNDEIIPVFTSSLCSGLSSFTRSTQVIKECTKTLPSSLESQFQLFFRVSPPTTVQRASSRSHPSLSGINKTCQYFGIANIFWRLFLQLLFADCRCELARLKRSSSKWPM